MKNKLVLEIDNSLYNSGFLNKITYSTLIIDNLNCFHLSDGVNCDFKISQNNIYIILKKGTIVSGAEVKTAILAKMRDKIVGRFLFPISGIQRISQYELKITTRFYAPLICKILQAPWLFNNLNNQSKKIKFILNRNCDDRIRLLKTISIDATWPSNGRWTDKKLKIEGYNFCNLPGNNIFTIHSKSIELINVINLVKSKILYEINQHFAQQFDFTSAFVKDIDKTNALILPSNNFKNMSNKKRYILGYQNYFPNKEICLVIQREVSPYINLQLRDLGYIEESTLMNKKIDGKLEILAPSFFSKYSILLGVLPDLEIDNKFNLLKDIYALNDIGQKYDLRKSKHYLPLLFSRNIFWQKNTFDHYLYDEFGRIKINVSK